MLRQSTRFILFVVLVSRLVFSVQQLKEKDLPQKYQDWLKQVSYIILSAERQVFMKLTSNRDRDIFIESFWKQRDPTPGTPQNEFKDEFIKRFNYANSYYRRGTSREGWMTDMGRIYIILGPPNSVERFEGTAGIYPCQVWYYYGDRSKGLPPFYALVFYQHGGSGEFKFYNPTSDGPLELLIDTKGIDLTDYEAIYEKIRSFAPTLASVAFSIIPGELPYNYMPSVQNEIILSEILESPKKNISPSYATHFLNYKGIVSTEYLTNYVDSAAAVALVKDPVLGISFCHFALAPKKISVDSYAPRNEYYCDFKIDVSLRAGEKIIFQYAKDFPFYFPPDKVANVQANGVALEDSFPVAEGRYGLTVLLQNSVGKEFTVFEKEITIPAAANTPQLVGPVLGYGLQTFPGQVHTPFKFLDYQLQVDPNGTFSAKDEVAFFFNVMNLTEELWKEGDVAVFISGLREREPQKKSVVLKLKDSPYQKVLGLAQDIPAGELSPDYYEMRLALRNGNGEAVAETKTQFVISPQEAVSHPVTLAKSLPLANSFLFYYALAHQYEQVGQTDQAEANFEKAVSLNPNYGEGLAGYADFQVRMGKPDRALEIIERIKGNEQLNFDYFLTKGRALLGKGDYSQAIENLLEANKIYNSDTRLLNSLGFCYYKTGQAKAALEALSASLRLNPDQKDIKELVTRIEAELK